MLTFGGGSRTSPDMIKIDKTGVAILSIVVFFTLGCGRSAGDRPAVSGKDPAGTGQVAGPAGKQEENDRPADNRGVDVGGQLRQAALDGDALTLRSLLGGAPEVDAPDAEGHTALMFAAFNGHTGIVRALLDAGADVGRKDFMGRTALLYAATGPFPETVELLLEKGAEPNIADQNEHFTPLMHAAAEGNLEVVKLLVQTGADPGLTDVDGDNAESFARQGGHTEVAGYLSRLDGD